MSTLQNDILIDQIIEEVEEEYPHLSFEEQIRIADRRLRELEEAHD